MLEIHIGHFVFNIHQKLFLIFFCNKLITTIKTENEVKTNPKDILDEGKKYNMNLYSDDSRSSLDGQPVNIIEQGFLNSMSLPKLNDNQKSQCEGLMTESELSKVLKPSKTGQKPWHWWANCRIL